MTALRETAQWTDVCAFDDLQREWGAAALVDGPPDAAPDGTRWLRISVSDNGEGIAPENLTRVFSHGFTTRRDGHGFGLHTCALAAREMGGRLTAHSDGPGQGATFILDLPAVPAKPPV